MPACKMPAGWVSTNLADLPRRRSSPIDREQVFPAVETTREKPAPRRAGEDIVVSVGRSTGNNRRIYFHFHGIPRGSRAYVAVVAGDVD